MPFHTVENPDGSTTFTEVAQGNGSGEVRVVFANGADIAFGRGQTDADETYIKLNRQDGSDIYISVPTGTTVVASATRP